LKRPSGSIPLLVVAEGADLVVAEEFQLGDADAMLAGDHAAEALRQRHDALHRFVGGLQHRVVVRVHRDVGMHVAVAGVHVQGDENAAAQHLLVDRLDAGQHRAEGIALEQGFQRRLEFGLPRHPQAVILQLAEVLVEFVEQRLPAGAHAGDKLQRLLALVAQQQFRIEVGVARVQRQFALQEFRQRIGQRDLVAPATARC
jgi:hypothetical protein